MITELISQLIDSLNRNGTAYALILMLSAFLGRLWAGRYARKEDARVQERITRLQGDLQDAQSKLAGRVDTSVHIHKAQFEKEFAVYQQLIKDMNKTRTAFYTLHPMLKEIFDSPGAAHEHSKPYRDDFAGAYEAVKSTIEDNKPFYPREIFTSCDAFIELCVDEIASLRSGPGEGVNDWKKQEHMKKQFGQLINEINDGIRCRLESITVID